MGRRRVGDCPECCDDSSSGGGGGILLPCCPAPIPLTITASIKVTTGSGCGELDAGIAFPLEFCPDSLTKSWPSATGTTCTGGMASGGYWYGEYLDTPGNVRHRMFFYCHVAADCAGKNFNDCRNATFNPARVCTDLAGGVQVSGRLLEAVAFSCSPFYAKWVEPFNCFNYPGFTCLADTLTIELFG